jgi:hypothetical protein
VTENNTFQANAMGTVQSKLQSKLQSKPANTPLKSKRCTKLGWCACESFGWIKDLAFFTKSEAAVVRALDKLQDGAYGFVHGRRATSLPEVMVACQVVMVFREEVDAVAHSVHPRRLAQLLTHHNMDMRHIQNKDKWYSPLALICMTYIQATSLRAFIPPRRCSNGMAAYAVYEAAMCIICTWALQLGACPAIGLWDSREGLQRSPLECLRCFRVDAAAHAMNTLFLAAGCRHTCVDKSWTNGSGGPLTLVEDWVAWHQWCRWHGRRPRRVWAAIVAQ